MDRLKLFFTFFGGKWRIAKKYPKPQNDLIIEPFAGSAGYSLHYPDKKVILNDIDPIIFSVWEYLISVKEQEILDLPTNIEDVRTLHIAQEAKWLIGFWLNKCSVQPRNLPSKWMREGLRPNSFWGDVIKFRIASQLQYIRHWQIHNDSFEQIENRNATWFIDPPYHRSGHLYRFNKIDYELLADWCRNLKGQVIVCEQADAVWLPFTEFCIAKGLEGKNGKKISKEMIWHSNNKE